MAPSIVSGGCSLAFLSSTIESGCFAVAVSDSEEVPRAEAATDPIPITALPKRLIAEYPVPSKMVVAVNGGASSAGGGGRGRSSSLGLALLAAVMLSVLGGMSARFGMSSTSRFEEGVVGGETVMVAEVRLLGCCGRESFFTGAIRCRSKMRALGKIKKKHI